jgi:hypothetical protein
MLFPDNAEIYALNSHYTPGSGNGALSSGNSFVSRREFRANNITGMLPVPGAMPMERGYSGTFDFEQLIQSLHELFERDRQIASQPDATRCGICYLHFPVSELYFRDEEGFYACKGCEGTLGKHKMAMIRRQQKIG